MKFLQLAGAGLALLGASMVQGQAIMGRDSINKQIRAESHDLAQVIFDQLPLPDMDFINNHVVQITNSTLSNCEKCKFELQYARQLIDQYPDKQHLVTLLLYKVCVIEHKGSSSDCSGSEFFLSTGRKFTDSPVGGNDTGVFASSFVSFYDNDFLQVLKNFDIDNDDDLTLYCRQVKSVCIYPNIDDFVEKADLDSKWPAKESKHYQQPTYSSSTRETFNVLHLSDSHVELGYRVGTESNCSQYMCCEHQSYNTKLPSSDYNFTDYLYTISPSLEGQLQLNYSFYPDAHYEGDTFVKGDYYDFVLNRGYSSNFLPSTTWGGYKCDVPEVLFNSTLKHILSVDEEKNFEFAIFTGDLVDHDSVYADPQVTKEVEFITYGIMKHYLNDTKLYPTLGNHDAFPYAQMAPIKFDYNNSYNWNEEMMSELWTSNGWVPENETSAIRHHYAGYAVETTRGLKIISINSNTYYTSNLWNYLNATTEYDLFEQWQFLIDELVDSESKDQRVWIIAHVPLSQNEAIPTQARIFHKIVDRFSPYTIASIFFGHTHSDQFNVFYRTNSSKEVEDVVNMAWVSHSVTPLQYKNPAWRYYEVEDESFNIMDSINYYTKLNDTFTNGGDEPVWEFEYSARSAYDPDSEWPEDAPLNGTFWHNFVASKLKDKSNIQINQLYSDYQIRRSPYAANCSNGDNVTVDCYEDNYCDVSSLDAIDYESCVVNL